MKIIKRAVYRFLWAVSVWTNNTSMKILRGMNANDPEFINGRYENEMLARAGMDH